ncbi:HAD family hydrolase [Kibdelosporangium philippinense]|uniref:HAD family hydrolase n=1 Tax=Kibdelosporangium philippinense TaxID=211113 RepID=A0ABS8ZWT6_9PSEU|nr:HAD family hydrolase [Kibdelosporangium philippinense]MCE7010848.1 HAD family hydrolase [Kibdelosporangium philippinense]
MTDCLLFDVDGTLVDTNFLHTVAWHRAFLRFDLVVPNWRIHRAIGMGGDQLVPALVGEKTEADIGDKIRQAWADEYQPLIEQVRPFEGAHRLLAEAASNDVVVVLASSGPPDHVEHYIDLLDARDIAAAWTTSEDVSETKPAPELLEVALGKVSVERASVVGDSVWDCDAASRSGLPSVGTLTGGTSRAELIEHGAVSVYEHLDQLRADLNDLPYVRLDETA